MMNVGLLVLALWDGTLVGPYRVAIAEPCHHQVSLRAAMAADGHFAIAWLDSLQLPTGSIPGSELNLYIRFFDRDGNPLADAYKIPKLYGTTWVYYPSLDMDSAGNTVLVWTQDKTVSDTKLSNLRFMSFKPDGTPLDSAKTLYSNVPLEQQTWVSLSDNDECAVVFRTSLGGRGGYWVQRFNLAGVPQDSAFLAHDTSVGGRFRYPRVSLNDAGDVVVTWLEPIKTSRCYPRFQVFNSEDEPILPWEPMGYRLDDGGERAGACRPEPHWIDNDRFLVFWTDYCVPPYSHPLLGRVFSDRGLTRHPIRTVIWGDSLWLSHGGAKGWYSTAVSPNDSFAYTHTRSYYDYPDTSDPWKLRTWEHGGGILGYIQDNEPIRRTNLFEYTPPWGADTVNSFFENWAHVQTPAVACCNDRIVWVYSRLNTDTIFEAYAMITDWNIGEGISEFPIHTASPIQLEATLNRLSYDLPGEARLTLYSADGRRVLEETIKGKGIWTPSSPSSSPSSPPSSPLPSGVYFARVKNNSASARAKLVILH